MSVATEWMQLSRHGFIASFTVILRAAFALTHTYTIVSFLFYAILYLNEIAFFNPMAMAMAISSLFS